MAEPYISIVTTCLNAIAHIKATVRSILSQDYDCVEYLIIDAGSTDGTLEFLGTISDSRVKVLVRPGIGQYSAIHEGFQMSHGKVFAYINADDMYYPWTLSLVDLIFKRFPEVRWLTGTPSFFDTNGHCTKVGSAPPSYPLSALRNGWFGPGFLSTIQQESTFWSRELYESVGGLEPEFHFSADYQLFVKFAQQSELVAVTVPLAGFRRTPGQRSAIGKSKYEEEVARIRRCDSWLSRAAERFCGLGLTQKYLVQLLHIRRSPVITYDEPSRSWVLLRTWRSSSPYSLGNLRLARAARRCASPELKAATS